MTHKVQRTLLCDSVICCCCCCCSSFLFLLHLNNQRLPFQWEFQAVIIIIKKTLPRVYNSLCIALTFFLSFSDVSRTHVLLLRRFKELAKKRLVFVHTKCIFESYVQLILRVTGSKLLLRLFILFYKLLDSDEHVRMNSCEIYKHNQARAMTNAFLF